MIYCSHKRLEGTTHHRTAKPHAASARAFVGAGRELSSVVKKVDDDRSLTPSPSPEGRGEMYGGKWFVNQFPNARYE